LRRTCLVLSFLVVPPEYTFQLARECHKTHHRSTPLVQCRMWCSRRRKLLVAKTTAALSWLSNSTEASRSYSFLLCKPTLDSEPQARAGSKHCAQNPLSSES